jgi:flagellar biosynthesis protein
MENNEFMAKRTKAFAIKDNKNDTTRPKIVAKGHGKVAEKILRLAFDNDIRVRTDEDLVEILSVVEEDCEIPLEALAVVAEILSYVYNANSKMQGDKKNAEKGCTK